MAPRFTLTKGRSRRGLRALVLDCGLEETFKWGSPCYMSGESNLVMLYPQKHYCTLAFMKGVLLKDEKKILVAPGEHSQSARRAHFTNVEEITKLAPTMSSAAVSLAITQPCSRRRVAAAGVEFVNGYSPLGLAALRNIFQVDVHGPMEPGHARGLLEREAGPLLLQRRRRVAIGVDDRQHLPRTSLHQELQQPAGVRRADTPIQLQRRQRVGERPGTFGGGRGNRICQ